MQVTSPFAPAPAPLQLAWACQPHLHPSARAALPPLFLAPVILTPAAFQPAFGQSDFLLCSALAFRASSLRSNLAFQWWALHPCMYMQAVPYLHVQKYFHVHAQYLILY